MKTVDQAKLHQPTRINNSYNCLLTPPPDFSASDAYALDAAGKTFKAWRALEAATRSIWN